MSSNSDFITNFINWAYRTGEGAKKALGGAGDSASSDSGQKSGNGDFISNFIDWAYRTGEGVKRAFDRADKQMHANELYDNLEFVPVEKEEKKEEPKEDEDTVTFTLPRANDPAYRGFGQKIIDLGLATDKGLWGDDGDVAYYTQQLWDQDALDERGNLKIGVPITLKRRK